jgi:cold shock CspA family protein
MTKGTILFFNYQKGFGKVSIENRGEEAFAHISQIQGNLIPLLEHQRLQGELVVFDTETTSKGIQAKNINLDLTLRAVGYVTDYDEELGFGKITEYNTTNKFHLHYKKIKGWEPGSKYVRIEVGESVVFTKNRTEKGFEALDVVLVDERYSLEQFAIFQNLNQSLKELVLPPTGIAEKEDGNWDYIKKPIRGIPVLFSYMNQTFLRISESQPEKLVRGRSSDGNDYIYFNTGLVTTEQEEIYAYFIKNERYAPLSSWGATIPEWKFLEFNTNQSRYRIYFSSVPAMATYFGDAEITQLIFDPSINQGEIVIHREHIRKRKHRFPSQIASLDDEQFFDKLKEAIALAIKRAKRNYKTAIPHFYDGKIQFLLPLCMLKKSEADLALVVNREESIYKAHTVLTLDQAYNNARLLAKPDREWLNP